MFLLILYASKYNPAGVTTFKFHYVSINSKTVKVIQIQQHTLNSIMFLLILDSEWK